jgi:hypothetical protein
MTEPSTITYGGGWGSSYPNMSPGLQMRIAAADAQYEREGAAQAQARRERAAVDEEARVRASIEQAIERGEAVDVRRAYADGGVGHEPREFIEYASAVQDVEDARRAAEAAVAFRKYGEQFYGDVSADVSAPTPAEVAEREEMQARAEKYRAKRDARGTAISDARNAARMDREFGRPW